MTEFNKETFVTDYVEAVKKNDTEATQEVLGRLTVEQDFDQRIELVKEILKALEEAEGDYSVTEEFLTKQIQLLEVAKETEEQDSTSEEAKDDTQQSASVDTKAEEATQDVAADTGADNADENVAEAATPVAESGGYAPTAEEEEGKSE